MVLYLTYMVCYRLITVTLLFEGFICLLPSKHLLRKHSETRIYIKKNTTDFSFFDFRKARKDLSYLADITDIEFEENCEKMLP